MERSFRTSAGVDVTAPQLLSVTPLYNSTVPLNTRIQWHYDERLNPLLIQDSQNNYYLRRVDNAQYVPVKLVLSPDGRTITFQPQEDLIPNTRYELYVYSPQADLAGNRINSHRNYFYTGSATASALTVVTQSVGNNLTEIPLNADFWFEFNTQIDPSCMHDDTVQLFVKDGTEAIAGTVELSDSSTYNRRWIRFTPDTLLPETEYVFRFKGLCDVAGNQLETWESTYRTGSVEEDTTRPSIVSVSPADEAQNVAVDSVITLTFSEAIQPYNGENLQVSVNGNRLAGSYTMDATQTVLRFTPETPLPADTEVKLYLYHGHYSDLAGNTGGYNTLNSSFHTAVAGADTTAPTVISITPNDNAVDVDHYTDVVLTFSESLDSSTINDNNFALFAGGEQISSSVQRSLDNRTVTLSAYLPTQSIISVAVTGGVKDLSGNAFADAVWLFSTGSNHDNSRPRISTFKPGNSNNVAVDRPIVMYSNEALDATSVQQPEAFYVSQNGQLIEGEISLRGDGRILVFIPQNPFITGSLIQVFATNAITDTTGNALQNYAGSFRVAESTTNDTLRIVAQTDRHNLPLNPVLYLRFNKVLDPSSVSTDSVRLSLDWSENIPSAVELLEDGKTIRVQPEDLLVQDDGSNYRLSATVNDLAGTEFSYSWWYYLATDAVEQTVAAPLVSLSPASGLQDVALNTRIVARFDQPIEPLTLNVADLVAGHTGSISMLTNNKGFIYTPHTPLAEDSATTLNLAGLQDIAGNTITTAQTTFNTGTRLDLEAPVLRSISQPVSGTEDFPVNGVVELHFDEVLEPGSLHNLYVYDTEENERIAIDVQMSANARTLTAVPVQNLAMGRRYYYASSVTDLAGNHRNNGNTYFTTSLDADTTDPTVVDFNVPEGLDDVPTNVQLQVLFDEPIKTATLATGIRLYHGTELVPVHTYTWSEGGRLARLQFNHLLSPNTDYRIVVDDVTDRAGNVLPAAMERHFRTGAGVDIKAPKRLSMIPLNNSTAPLNTRIQWHYDERLNPLLIHDAQNNYYLRRTDNAQHVPVKLVLSADGRTINFQPQESLVPDTRYQLYFTGIRDLASNNIGSHYHYFDTGSAVAETLKVVAQSVGNNLSEVPLNADFWFELNTQLDHSCVRDDTVQLFMQGSSVSVASSIELSDSSTYSRRWIHFIPDILLPETEYTFQFNNLCDVAGNQLETWESTYRTGTVEKDTTRPSIVSVSPANEANDIAVDSVIILTFSEAILPYNGKNLEVRVNGSKIAGSYTMDATQTVLHFTPENPLPADTEVKLYLYYGSYFDLAGNIGYNTFNSSFHTAP